MLGNISILWNRTSILRHFQCFLLHGVILVSSALCHFNWKLPLQEAVCIHTELTFTSNIQQMECCAAPSVGPLGAQQDKPGKIHQLHQYSSEINSNTVSEKLQNIYKGPVCRKMTYLLWHGGIVILWCDIKFKGENVLNVCDSWLKVNLLKASFSNIAFDILKPLVLSSFQSFLDV